MASEQLVEKAKARIGTVLRDKWRLDTLLGVGGSASVYAATHRNGKRAAIKLLHPELAAEKDFVDRFLREGYVANKIDHPAAVQIQDDDVTDDGNAFLVMELLEGYTLERRLRKKVAVPILEALKYTEELLEVIAAAHEKKVIHRDIKPANIFVTKQKVVKVLDFGIARITEAVPGLQPGATQMGMPLGTPAFMPPEQARGRWDEVDERTDLWAVGATLYALIIGDRPRRAPTSNEELLLAMTQPLPPLKDVAPGTNSEVCKLVDRAVAIDMKARWPNAKTMQQALRLAALLVQAAGTPEGEAAASSIAALYEPAPVTAIGTDGESFAEGGGGISLPPPDDRGLTTGRAITKAQDDLAEAEARGGKTKWVVLALVAALAATAFILRGKITHFVKATSSPAPVVTSAAPPASASPSASTSVAPTEIAPAISASAAPEMIDLDAVVDASAVAASASAKGKSTPPKKPAPKSKPPADAPPTDKPAE